MVRGPRIPPRATRKQVVRPIRVKTVAQSCEWCPSQWEGRTVDNRPIYARYRYGCLCVHLGRVGGTMRQAIRSGRELVRLTIGDRLDGAITYAELKRHTRGLILWPRRFRRIGLAKHGRVVSGRQILKRLRSLQRIVREA